VTQTRTSKPQTTDLIRAHAEGLTLEEYARAQKRLLDLAEQKSAVNPPDVRIRAWEKVHALRLPGDPEHAVLHLVAMSTGLTLAQVRQEQSARLALRTAPRHDQEPISES
jgi:hypothetical protein